MNNKKAVIYCRVSTKEQVEEGNSLVTQERLCREYALKHDYEIVQAFIEQGESAKTTDRTELQKLLKFCAANKINAVIAYKLDRLSRNVDGYSEIRLLLKRYGVEIKSTSEQFDNNPAGRFMENIIANVAQFDNDVRAERCVNGMKEAMREGRYTGTALLGYDNVRINGKGTIAPNNIAPLITKAFDLLGQNRYTTEEVRKLLNKEGLHTKYGKYLSRSQFNRVIRNKTYTGWICKFGETHRGLYEPLVSEDLFNRVQRLIRRKKPGKTYVLNNPDFPLRRFVRHPSGLKLTGSWSQGKTKRFAYYRFLAKGMEYPKKELETIYKRFLSYFKYDETTYPLLKKALTEALITKQEDKAKEAKLVLQTIANLQTKQTTLIQKNIDGIISDQLLQQQLSLVESELDILQERLILLPNANRKLDELLSAVEVFLKNPSKMWEKASIETQYKLQWFEFPQGVAFDGMTFRTQQVCFLFKAQSFFLTQLSLRADSKLTTSNTPDVPTFQTDEEIQWELVADEIEKLASIVQEVSTSTKTDFVNDT